MFCFDSLERRTLFSLPTASPGPAHLLNANTNTEAGFDMAAETTIAVNPKNPKNFIGGANDVHFADDSPAAAQIIRAHVTFDGGKTWTDYHLPFPDTYGSTADPSVAFDADGRAYFVALAVPIGHSAPDLLAFQSSDGGRTWSQPQLIATRQLTGNIGVFNDKPYVVAWGHGNALVTYTRFDEDVTTGQFLDGPIYDTLTHNGGHTWSSVQPISGPDNFDQTSTPVLAADGFVYVSFADFNHEDPSNDFRDEYAFVKVDPNTGSALTLPSSAGTIFDGVFDYPRMVFGSATYQDSQLATNPYGNIAADPTRPGHLAIVWSDMRNNPYPNAELPSLDPYEVQTNSDIIVSQTFDGGKTWTLKTIARPMDQFMPWSAFDETGRLQIGFYDRSYDPANHKYGYTIASEQSRGNLDFAFTQISTALSDPTKNLVFTGVTANPDYPNAATFVGDYSNITVVPGRSVAALWTDLRETTTFLGETGFGESAYFGIMKTTPAALASLADASFAPDHAIALLADVL